MFKKERPRDGIPSNPEYEPIEMVVHLRLSESSACRHGLHGWVKLDDEDNPLFGYCGDTEEVGEMIKWLADGFVKRYLGED